MEVKLLDYTKLSNCVIGARTCYNSFDKGGCYDYPTDDISEDDKRLLDRLINVNSHGSIGEHTLYVFSIKGISRLNLIELTRHRMASYSVRSTRYTLRELKQEEPFKSDDWLRASKYINLTGDTSIDSYSILALDNLRVLISQGKKNDLAKYALPESYKVDLVWSVNMRSLKNFLKLRLSGSAHFEIRELAGLILDNLPAKHKFLFEKGENNG